MIDVQNTDIQVVHIDNAVEIPYVDIQRGKGPVILITAGMDGDEYVGQEAAWRLCRQFLDDDTWEGRRIIFPRVNIHGHAAGLSYNPVDNKFLKHIYPGKKEGSQSEKILFQIFNSISNKIDLWLDLHGGSNTEELSPFIWAFPYGDKQLQQKAIQLLQSIQSVKKVFAPWEKVRTIAEDGIVYLVLECGQLGTVVESDINEHIQWVKALIHNWGQDINRSDRLLTHIHYYTAPQYGIWQLYQKESTIAKHDTLGVFSTLSPSRNKIISSTHNGVFLWRHKGGWVKKGDILYAVGS